MTAEPTPALASGTEPTISWLAGGMMSAMPAAANTRAAATSGYDEAGSARLIKAKPVAADTKPAMTTARTPNRPTTRGPCGEISMSVNALGSTRTPAASGEYAFTNCKYWLSKKNSPNMLKNPSVTMAAPVENPRERNSAGSSIGLVLRRS